MARTRLSAGFGKVIYRLGWLTVLLAGCGSPSPLPPYQTPIAHTQFQTVRTTAYTHTEADHLAYGNHNALGGTLHAAQPQTGGSMPPAPRDSEAGTAFDDRDSGEGGFHAPTPMRVANSAPHFAANLPANGIGSAAADWSRWPAGTIFRLQSTGQVYKVDDYGWALAGRNTIDLYQPTRGMMDAWGVRNEPIEILQWGDPAESLRLLRNHQDYRHIRRMVLELEGHAHEAAELE